MKKLAILVFFTIPFISFAQQNSILSSGDWYKLAVEETGVYKLTYSELQSYGIDVDNIDPRNLALFGNPSGMLPELLEEPHYTDLQPMAIQIIGEDDGVFDPEDYVLFFGQGSVVWEYDADQDRFQHMVNLYAEKTNYFLTVLEEAGKRIQLQQSETLAQTAIIDTLDLLIYHENEWINPGKSGKVWLGEFFNEENLEQDFSFNLEDFSLYPNGHQFYTQLMARSFETSFFNISINDVYFDTIRMNNVSPSNLYQLYKYTRFDSFFNLSENVFTVLYNYLPANEFSWGWLDCFDLNLKVKPIFTGDQMPFRSTQNMGEGSVSFYALNYSQASDLKIWNVTNPLNVSELELNIETNSVWFKIKNDSLLEFHAFNGNTFYVPEFAGQIENQNLHAFEPPDLIIVTHPNFLAQANQLALFHETEDEMSVGTFTIDQIYNEFSTGTQDVTAIRNFVRYLWEQSGDEEKPKYLLLFGDASYDYLDRMENNTNFVPTYESWESSNSVSSYATDQYFGLKELTGFGEMQVAVGRIPVSTVEDANKVLNKIQAYNSNEALGSWTNEMMFIGDDGDGNLHLKDVERLARVVDTASPVMNITKCYLDFFELIQTDDGPRYPEANATITNKTNDGVFYVGYAGHGGKVQLTHERILSIDDLSDWTNKEKLPLWVIASGDVAYYDDPGYTSLGESVFLKDDAGAIAVLSTTRATFAAANMSYTLAVIEKITDQNLQNDLRFGDLTIHGSASSNDLKWTLLGDPALKIHFPKYNVNTTTLNNIAIEEFSDTIPPGSYLTFQGEILSKDEGILQSGFNGTVYLKVFAPSYIRTTRANQEGSYVEDVQVQDSILTEGTATIENGEFEIKVKLPTNYFEGFGNLKLSWYAENGETDANGYYNQLMFGGDPDAIVDGDEFLDQIKVYPTVFTDYLNIDVPQTESKELVYRVYNAMGVEIYSLKSNAVNGVERIQIPGLAKGMYILNIDVAANSRNFKLFRY